MKRRPPGPKRTVPLFPYPTLFRSDDGPSHPVLIFLHGFLGVRQHNTYQIEELVSHGYIVAAIDQPYAAAAVVFPDGREVQGLDVARLLPLIDRKSTRLNSSH